jgi:hypothetical protein
MRLRIVRPLPPTFEDFDLTHLRFGASYEIPPPLSDLLLISGYGVPPEEATLGAGQPLPKGKAIPKPVKPKRSKRRQRSKS